MIDKASALNTILRMLEKVSVGCGIDVRSYKRNRSILIRKVDQKNFLVLQNGYEKNHYEENDKSIRKCLKTLFKKEFPRSTKLRVYQIAADDPNEPVERKTL